MSHLNLELNSVKMGNVLAFTLQVNMKIIA